MTVEEASKLNCPYKPYKTTLEGEPVPTCQPIGCMCWVPIVYKHYVNKMYVKEEANFDKERYPRHELYSTQRNGTNRVEIYGIPKKIEDSYCTLRGKDV